MQGKGHIRIRNSSEDHPKHHEALTSNHPLSKFQEETMRVRGCAGRGDSHCVDGKTHVDIWQTGDGWYSALLTLHALVVLPGHE